MKAYSRNPWLVKNIDDFNYLCCPECAYRSKDEISFESHAVENHPKSSALFDKTESPEEIKKKPIILSVLKKNVPKHETTVIDIATAQEYSQILDENEQDYSNMIDIDAIKQDIDDGIFEQSLENSQSMLYRSNEKKIKKNNTRQFVVDKYQI